MALILCIETSTQICSVALCENGVALHAFQFSEGNSHATHLTTLIEKLFSETTGYNMQNIDAVAVSSGPGSYTGLRIGVSTAKGICYALNIPLIAVNSLETMTWPMLQHPIMNDSRLLCPMIDARRMEVYTTLFNHNMLPLQPVSAQIITHESFSEALNHQEIVFFGDGAEKCKDTLTHPNAVFIDGISPLAENLSIPAHEAYLNSKFEDVAYFEPFYLKDFVATTPKNKVI
jgi:tRNA threonylcarbamoyladenosine biosynthesis protein TsaB